MPMPMLEERDVTLRGEHSCSVCEEPSKYLYKNAHWCRECLDKEQYPSLAHLTQEEREQMRRARAEGVKQRGVINADNFKVGFN